VLPSDLRQPRRTNVEILSVNECFRASAIGFGVAVQVVRPSPSACFPTIPTIQTSFISAGTRPPSSLESNSIGTWNHQVDLRDWSAPRHQTGLMSGADHSGNVIGHCGGLSRYQRQRNDRLARLGEQSPDCRLSVAVYFALRQTARYTERASH
jgi:hypothetical protein